MRERVFTIATLALAGTACAQYQQTTAVIDAQGLRYEQATSHEVGPFQSDGGFTSRDSTILWSLVDPGSITNSVALTDTTGHSFLGHNLNFERLGYHMTTGSATPVWEYDLLPKLPNSVGVAAAEDGDRAAMITNDGKAVRVRAFDASSNVPEWTYTFAPEFTAAGTRMVDISDDGSVVVAIGRDPVGGISRVVVLNGADGSVVNSQDYTTNMPAIEIARDGTRAVITDAATARTVDLPSLTTVNQFAVSGVGGYARISGDGMTVASGGFNLRAFRETSPGVWTSVHSSSLASHWLGNGIALSDDGQYMFMAAYNYATGYLTLTYQTWDLNANSMIAQTSTTGTGSFQDTVQISQASADGSRFAVASWGVQDNAHPEVQVFDQDLNLIGCVDTPGSPFDMEMSRNGQYLLVGCKSVHANTFGSGSNSYSVELPTDCIADWNGSGDVLTDDFIAYLNDYNAVLGGGSPTYGDPDIAAPIGVLNTADFIEYLNQYNAGCP